MIGFLLIICQQLKKTERVGNLIGILYISIFDKFIDNSGVVTINQDTISVGLKKKRNLPLLLTALQKYKNIEMTSLDSRKITFSGLSSS